MTSRHEITDSLAAAATTRSRSAVFLRHHADSPFPAGASGERANCERPKSAGAVVRADGEAVLHAKLRGMPQCRAEYGGHPGGPARRKARGPAHSGLGIHPEKGPRREHAA